MKKRSTAALIAAMAVVAAGIFISFFLSFSNQNDAYVITLPGQGSAVIDTSHDIGETNRNKVQTISVDVHNFQAIVASLERPQQYQCQLTTTYFYSDRQTAFHSKLWKAGEMVRISQLNTGDMPGQQALLTSKWVYLWDDAGQYSRFARQENDMDLYSRAPSYEDLITLPKEQLLVGELREQDGQLCLYAESLDAVTGEQEVWYVLVENGLLLYASGTLDGSTTYISQMTELQLELDEEATFILPDGTKPQ